MQYIMRRINTVSRCSLLYRAEKTEQSDINPCHHSYILAISHNPGVSQEELAQHLCINKSSVTRNLSQLEENGYIRREPCKTDKRVTLVYPTEKLEMILPKIRHTAREWNAYLTEGISESEMEIFHSVLDRIYERARLYSEEVSSK